MFRAEWYVGRSWIVAGAIFLVLGQPGCVQCFGGNSGCGGECEPWRCADTTFRVAVGMLGVHVVMILWYRTLLLWYNARRAGDMIPVV